MTTGDTKVERCEDLLTNIEAADMEAKFNFFGHLVVVLYLIKFLGRIKTIFIGKLTMSLIRKSNPPLTTFFAGLLDLLNIDSLVVNV